MQTNNRTQETIILKELELYKKDISMAKPLFQSIKEFSIWLAKKEK